MANYQTNVGNSSGTSIPCGGTYNETAYYRATIPDTPSSYSRASATELNLTYNSVSATIYYEGSVSWANSHTSYMRQQMNSGSYANTSTTSISANTCYRNASMGGNLNVTGKINSSHTSMAVTQQEIWDGNVDYTVGWTHPIPETHRITKPTDITCLTDTGNRNGSYYNATTGKVYIVAYINRWGSVSNTIMSGTPYNRTWNWCAYETYYTASQELKATIANPLNSSEIKIIRIIVDAQTLNIETIESKPLASGNSLNFTQSTDANTNIMFSVVNNYTDAETATLVASGHPNYGDKFVKLNLQDFISIIPTYTDSTDKTITGNASIERTGMTETLDGDGYIMRRDTDTLQGNAYIATRHAQTLSGDAYIANRQSTTLYGNSFVRRQPKPTILGNAYIEMGIPNVGIQGNAYIKKILDTYINANAMILNRNTEELEGNAFLRNRRSETITGDAMLIYKPEKYIYGNARIKTVEERTLQGNASIFNTIEKYIYGNAFIRYGLEKDPIEWEEKDKEPDQWIDQTISNPDKNYQTEWKPEEGSQEQEWKKRLH